MKTLYIQINKSNLANKLFTFGVIVILSGLASVAGATYSLPASRSITWQGNVGVKGDITARTTIYKTLIPTGGDDTTAIQAALNSCPSGQVVQLESGTFHISNIIKIPSNVTLRGKGMGTTVIQGKSGYTGASLAQIVNPSYGWGTSINITGGLSKGSTSITTATAHGWTVGDVIVIDQLNNASGDPVVNSVGNNGSCTWCGRSSGARSLGQVAKIVAIPTTTSATLELPLYWNFSSSLTPQGTKLNYMSVNAGIEDLTLDNSLSGNSNQTDNGVITLRYAANCWLSQVEVIGSWQQAVYLNGTYRVTIRGCKLHEGVPATPIDGPQYAPDHAYGIALLGKNSAGLFENNELYHLRLPYSMSGVASGNVFAYNYVTQLYGDSATTSGFQLTASTTHGAHPMMNLIEGNYFEGCRLRADDVFGSSSHNTFFRNRVSLDTKRTSGGVWNLDLHSKQHYYNVIGNVFGTVGFENTNILNNVSLSGQKAIHRVGYTSDGDSSATGNDAQVYATILRHGNWDSVTNGVTWNNTDDRLLPPSLYLSSKPNWWNNLPWPAIGPDVTPMYPAPLGAGKGTPWNRSGSSLTPPPSLQLIVK